VCSIDEYFICTFLCGLLFVCSLVFVCVSGCYFLLFLSIPTSLCSLSGDYLVEFIILNSSISDVEIKKWQEATKGQKNVC
jgi:hypothetical protein